MSSKAHLRLVFALVPLILIGVGYGAGYLTAAYPTSRQIQRRAAARTLGSIAADDAERRAAFSQAYFDPTQALAELDAYSWSVPTTPAPFLNYVPQPGSWDNAEINAQGLRDARPLTLPKPPEARRVFLVGGSTAYGSGAPSQDRTIGAYLERALKDAGVAAEVWTFASPAWTSTHERIAIVNRVSEWEPDLVVTLSGANDTYWSQYGHDTLWARTYEDAHFYALLDQAYTSAGQPLIDVTQVRPDPYDPAEVARRFRKNVTLARAALGEVPLLVALQPALALSKKPLSAREQAALDAKRAEFERRAVRDGGEVFDEPAYWAACFDGFAAALAEREVQALDLRGVFDERSADDEVFLDAMHFGDRGNQWIAAALAPRVVDLLE
ncbi:MAG: SGNH/GDSL hydrolase family protein [Planctomycetes bacterium]|nr:SGNH/GDSL hydrolase family protein [Planctomycetota bacterium]